MQLNCDFNKQLSLQIEKWELDEIRYLHEFLETNKGFELTWDAFFDKAEGKEVKAVLIGRFEKTDI